MKSVCDNQSCPNYKIVANHPRSDPKKDNPLVCGMCGHKVRMI